MKWMQMAWNDAVRKLLRIQDEKCMHHLYSILKGLVLDLLWTTLYLHTHLEKKISKEMESVVESLLGNARCEESSFGRVGSRHQRGQQRHCPAKLRNNAQNRTELPQEMGILRNGAQRAEIDSQPIQQMSMRGCKNAKWWVRRASIGALREEELRVRTPE